VARNGGELGRSRSHSSSSHRIRGTTAGRCLTDAATAPGDQNLAGALNKRSDQFIHRFAGFKRNTRAFLFRWPGMNASEV